MSVLIYTDGGCRMSKKVGAWGFIVINTENKKAIAKAEAVRDTTNNRMELASVLHALRLLSNKQTGTLVSDSQYTIKTCDFWLKGWKAAGWRKSTPGELKNVDILKDLDIELAKHHLTFQWVRGHSGNFGNEFVDGLLNLAMDDLLQNGEGKVERKFEQADARFFEAADPWTE